VFPDTGVGINTNKVDSEFPLSVRGNMKVQKLTGWTKEGVNSGGVTLQHDHTDILTVLGAGVTVTGVTTSTGGFVSDDSGGAVQITVGASNTCIIMRIAGAGVTYFPVHGG
jgi:hypothetical protein